MVVDDLLQVGALDGTPINATVRPFRWRVWRTENDQALALINGPAKLPTAITFQFVEPTGDMAYVFKRLGSPQGRDSCIERLCALCSELFHARLRVREQFSDILAC